MAKYETKGKDLLKYQNENCILVIFPHFLALLFLVLSGLAKVTLIKHVTYNTTTDTSNHSLIEWLLEQELRFFSGTRWCG